MRKYGTAEKVEEVKSASQLVEEAKQPISKKCDDPNCCSK